MFSIDNELAKAQANRTAASGLSRLAGSSSEPPNVMTGDALRIAATGNYTAWTVSLSPLQFKRLN